MRADEGRATRARGRWVPAMMPDILLSVINQWR